MTLLEWRGLVLILAVGIDLLFGEPSNRFHPVAWMGAAIARLKGHCPSNHWLVCLTWGLGITATGCLVLFALGACFELFASPATSEGLRLPLLVSSLLLHAAILKSCFGIRALWTAADSVRRALRDGSVADARRLLAFHLVSRNVQEMDPSQVSAATIESVAENTSDSVIAPLLFYLVAGIPGALIYRYVNTCDAMLGYRTASLEWIGKVPARVDDILNWIPARTTALLMLLSAWSVPGKFVHSLRTWWADSGKTASPNAGHPMSTAAGLLGVRLEKDGHYVLGSDLRTPGRHDIAAMNSLFVWTVLSAVAIASMACFLVGRNTP